MSANGGDQHSLLRRTAEWAWARDEVDPGSTPETLRYTVVMYTVTLGLIVAAGVVFVALGYRTSAFAVLLFGIWFTTFVGAMNVGWEFLKLRSARRRARRSAPEPTGPERELAVTIRLAEDTKIGFLVTVLALVVLFVSFELAQWLVDVL